MNNNEIYSTPESSLGCEPSTKPTMLNIVLVIVLSLLLMTILFLKQSIELGIAGGIGGGIGALIPAFVVVAVFQIGKQFRNSRSRWKIFGWSQFVFVLGQIASVLQMIGANA